MMRNRVVIIFLTLIVSILCLYYLSFSLLDARVQRQATAYATTEKGDVDFLRKQTYLDSVWKVPVFKFLGFSYTYEQVKENALNLGLDLQGGMHVTLEVSPRELIKKLAKPTADEFLTVVLDKAEAQYYSQSSLPFTQLFYRAYKEQNPAGRLNELFLTAANRSRLGREASDQEVLKYLDQEIEQAIGRAFEIIHSRIDRFGTIQPTMQRLPGTGKIQLELPGVNNPERVRKLLQGVAQLRFWEVYDIREILKTFENINQLWLAEEKGAAGAANEPTKKATDTTEAEALAAQLTQQGQTMAQDIAHISPLFKLLKLDYGTLGYAPADVKVIQSILERPSVKAILPRDLLFLWDVKPHKVKDGTEITSLYPIRAGKNRAPLLEGDVVMDARQVFDEYGRPAVSMQMSVAGGKTWKNITATHIGKPIAIALDDKVYSAPVVKTEIADRNSQITGSFSLEEAQDLANILRAGSLPAPVKITEEAIIGPTLSKVAQVQGIASMVAGLVLIVVFMLLYYAKGGMVANLALLFNILFIMGVLAQLNASLTLAGIAGIVLTMGMSIDANVLIFERIREELRKGAPMKQAIKQGYQKAHSSIIDANLTTFLVGLILYMLGQGPVRGFATTLMIGIVTSFFTAVFLTRVIFSRWIRLRHEETLTFSFSYNRDLLTAVQFPFLKKRRLFYGFSISFIAVGLGLMIYQKGLNVGVDFTGGRSYVLTFSQPIETSHLKAKLVSALGDQSAEVKSYGASHVVKITTNYRIDDQQEAAEEEIRDDLIRSIASATRLPYVEQFRENDTVSGFTIASATKVGPSIASDIQASAKKAVVLSLVGIFLYILLRFRRWQFGLAAVIALLHDTLTVFAAFAIARLFGFSYEIDQVFVAALLTVIGYSINDTVVIFDRIREMRYAHPADDFADIVNQSINQTLSRTLITSFTTLLAIFILLVWGGESLRGFSFALLVGVAFGTYSSICIAGPLMIDFSAKRVKETGEKKSNPIL
jgi:SecD/SecF fusion protein